MINMRKLVIVLIVLLFVLHQDSWWWDDIRPLTFGFMPIGLTWHVLLSIAAAGVWWLAVTYCWPADVDVPESEWLPEGPEARADGGGRDVEL